jgi:hypothetical protein
MKGCRLWLAGEPMSEPCREFRISRKTGYKILDRSQERTQGDDFRAFLNDFAACSLHIKLPAGLNL